MTALLVVLCTNALRHNKAALHSGSIIRSLSTITSRNYLDQSNSAFNCQKRTATTSFLNKLPAEKLWKGVTGVSNAGKKRGRGKGASRKTIKNLNKGQVIGVGKVNMLWPGLNAPIIRGKELVVQQKLPDDPEHEAKLHQLRNAMGQFRSLKISPIERGWSGNKAPGRSIGPPDPIGEDTFEGFDTKVLEEKFGSEDEPRGLKALIQNNLLVLKSVFNMTGNMGRKRRMSAFVVTGNGNGIGGFALGKGVESKGALRTAKNRTVQKLMFIERYNNHTVYHDFFTQFGKTKIFVYKKHEGYGLKCHRALKTICEVIGIKDMYAIIEGSTNLQHIVKAFFLGLLKQKTHKQLAEEVGLHLVEFRKEHNYIPEVVASPTVCTENVKKIPDFTQYIFDNRVVLPKKKKVPFYSEYASHKRHLWQCEKRRSHAKIQLQLKAEYGELRSFLTEKYPEARPRLPRALRRETEQQDAEQ